jgi:hypothetical protein
MASQKPIADRLKETVTILKDILGLGIPLASPEVQELKGHLDAYVKDGTAWQGSISFERFGRIAEVTIPKRADKAIEVRLRVPRAGR